MLCTAPCIELAGIFAPLLQAFPLSQDRKKAANHSGCSIFCVGFQVASPFYKTIFVYKAMGNVTAVTDISAADLSI
jgi:hypothetical protein